MTILEANKPLPRLNLTLERKVLSGFFPMLQKGCLVQCPKPVSVEEFLLALPGASDINLLEKIQTVFVDGHPVDDIKAAILTPDVEMALSAAMPGALGAVMRRGGYYASMRRHITFQAHESKDGQGAFFITVKLFNLLLSQAGPSLLQNGVVLDSRELGELARPVEAGFVGGDLDGKKFLKEEAAQILESIQGGAIASFTIQ
ncbi:hypothetical protein Dalk_2425 [Desulfatibacillum aliphaticivorans]|uniref:Uncharacterized protein n=1 Tax=Desulfatibacillum aliphaticivorans TaxID=218208 RepID=B8FB32_DESAL|nr:hypothetical protein [Desulfatibacillum aliphaticivorans]ACL04118.1 hypothetical protein Dalk_2425 [Desulfatibacillum aliphaticivorans]